MKLLFDQNISYKVAKRLKVSYPDCAQIRELGLENRSDREIWEFSKNEGFTIVSFDSDFYDLVTLYGHPPKIIWLRTGNTRTESGNVRKGKGRLEAGTGSRKVISRHIIA